MFFGWGILMYSVGLAVLTQFMRGIPRDPIDQALSDQEQIIWLSDWRKCHPKYSVSLRVAEVSGEYPTLVKQAPKTPTLASVGTHSHGAKP